MIKEKNEKKSCKKLFRNISSPLIFGYSNNTKNKITIIKKNNYNKKLLFKKKLTPLIFTNNKLFDKNQRNKSSFINPYFYKSILSSNNNEINNFNNEQKTLRLRGELANVKANNLMNKYFYPDGDVSHEQSNKINEEIDINGILTFYSRIKYLKEKEEIKKIIKKQKRSFFSYNENEQENDNENNYKSYNKNNSLIRSSDTKLINKRNIFINSYESLNNDKYIGNNNYIKLELNKKIYHSPIHSLDTIKKNKIIYDFIVKNYRKNTIKSFKVLENKLNPLLKLKFKLLLKTNKKIKVTTFMPKLIDQNYITTNRENEETYGQNKLKEEFINKYENIKKSMSLDFTKLLLSKRGEKYLLKNKIEYPYKNFPESRSEFIFAQEGREFILYGGNNVNRKYNLWKFNPNQKSWKSIEPTGINSEIRFAHTGVLHYRNLYIFGGKNFKGTHFGDIEIFNLDKKCWIFPKLESNKRIPLRRNHVACLIGNAMFVHGGISEENKYLNDQYILSIKPLKWNDIDINANSKIKIPSLAHHNCCLVMPEIIKNSSKFNIYNIPDLGGLENNNIKEKGIYIFGGIISDEGPINNNIYVLKVGKKPLEWIIIKTDGCPPCARFDSSLNFYERENILIIHGGRTLNGKYENGFNDTYILNLLSLNWIEVEYFDKTCIAPPRYLHQSIIIDGDLYIFGGINGNNYVGSEMFILNLNSKSKLLIE